MRSFINKNIYYIIQAIAWVLVAFQQILISIVFKDFRLNRSVFLIVLSIVCFLATHFYRFFAQKNKIFETTIIYQIRFAVMWSLLLSTFVGLISFYGAVIFLLSKKTKIIDLRFISIVLNVWILVGGWVFFYHLYQYFRKLLQKLEEKWELQKKLQETEDELLQLQINPHFLFNALNTIRALLLVSPLEAQKAIKMLGNLLVNGYSKIGLKKIKLSQELEIVENYINIEKIRFAQKLDFNIQVQKHTKDILVPAGILLTLVENAIKHGFQQANDKNEISLILAIEDNSLIISVSNAGTLKKEIKKYSGIGLPNIKKRLQLYFNNKFSIQQNFAENRVNTQINISLNI